MTQEEQNTEGKNLGDVSPAQHSADQTPHNTQTQKSPYVGFWVRAAAYIIDSFIIGIISFLISIILGMAIAFIDNKALSVVFYGMTYIISFGLTFVYYIFLTQKYQATLGKMAVGIKVVRDDGQRLPLGKIILRETIGKIISSFVLMIGYIMVAFTNKKQGLHDMMAHSVVIYKDPIKRAHKWVVGVVLGLYTLIFITIIAIFIGIVTLGAFFTSENGFFDANNGAVQDGYYDDTPYDNYDTDFYNEETETYDNPVDEYIGNEVSHRILNDDTAPTTTHN